MQLSFPDLASRYRHYKDEINRLSKTPEEDLSIVEQEYLLDLMTTVCSYAVVMQDCDIFVEFEEEVRKQREEYKNMS